MTAQDLLKQLRGDYDESTGYTGLPADQANQLLANYFASGGTTQDLTSNLTDENGNSIIPQDMFNSILNDYYSTIQPSNLTSAELYQAATGNPWGTTAGAIGELPEDAASVSVPVPTQNVPAGYIPYAPGQDLGDGNYIIDPSNVTTINGLTYTPKSNIHMHPYGDFLSHFGPALASAAFLGADALGALPGESAAVTAPLAASEPVVGTPLASTPVQIFGTVSQGGGVPIFGTVSGTGAGGLGAEIGGAGLAGAASTGSSLLDDILGGARKVLGLGSGSGLLSDIGDIAKATLGKDPLSKLLSLGGAYEALKYAQGLPPVDTSRLESIYNDATNNEMPYVNSLVDKVIGPTSQGYGNLVQGLGRRGVLGSSFANQQINNYDTDTARALGDVASSGLQSSLGLRENIASMINNLNLTNRQLKTNLIGRALGSAGMGLRSPAVTS